MSTQSLFDVAPRQTETTCLQDSKIHPITARITHHSSYVEDRQQGFSLVDTSLGRLKQQADDHIRRQAPTFNHIRKAYSHFTLFFSASWQAEYVSWTPRYSFGKIHSCSCVSTRKHYISCPRFFRTAQGSRTAVGVGRFHAGIRKLNILSWRSASHVRVWEESIRKCLLRVISPLQP